MCGVCSPSNGAPGVSYGGGKGGSIGGSGGNSSTAKYKTKGNGSSSKDYTKSNFGNGAYAAFERYNAPKIGNSRNSAAEAFMNYQLASPIDIRYRMPERTSRISNNPPSVYSPLEDEENKKKKRHIF